MSSAELETSKRLARLRDLCAGDGQRLDLLEAALALSALRHDEAIDLAPYRLHVAAMSADLADLVRRRGGTPEPWPRFWRSPMPTAATARPTTTCRTPTSRG